MHDSRETFLMKAFVAGYPIKHSRSPLIHKYWLGQLGIAGDYEAVAVEVTDFASFIANLKSGESGYRGGNITIPHKESAFLLADRCDDLATELGAVNTLWLEDGILCATNSDGIGFVRNLDERSPGWDQCKTAVVLGAGGASRAIIQSLRERGIANIHVVNRTAQRAIELADHFGSSIHGHALDALDEVSTGAGLFVNTTSLGMDGHPVPTLPLSKLTGDAVVTDIVYTPLVTPILEQAQRDGFRTVDGLGMLLHQAGTGFEKWFGQMPVVTEELRSLIISDLGLKA